MKKIVSRDNAVFKHLRSLSNDPRYRREHGASIADGEHLVVAALEDRLDYLSIGGSFRNVF